MAVDKNKLIAEAARLVQRGALDKAIAAYRKILAADPKDVRVLLKLGELHQRRGEARPAAEAFARVAETYADQGFFLKAIAVYKQIVRLDPGDAQVAERLASLYQQLGLLSDAMTQLHRVATAAEQAGDSARLSDVLRRMVELDPESVASTIKLGELHAHGGDVPAALECLRRAAGQLKRQGRTDEYVRVAERLVSLQPGDLPLIRELAHLHLARGDTKRALAKLQLCFKAEPGHVETLHLLARAFGDLGQHAKVVSVYRELALVHGEQGRHAESRATWEKVLELAPGDEEATTALAEAPPAAAPAPVSASAPRGSSPPVQRPPPPPVPEASAGPAVAPPAPRPASAAPPPPPSAPPRAPQPTPARPTPAPRPAAATAPALPTDPVARLLAEAEVYAKYGLHDRALQHLGKVLELDPDSADAHERARELHAAAHRTAEAADAGVAAVRALQRRGEAERARGALERLRELAPDHPQVAALGSGGEPSEEIALDAPEHDAGSFEILDAEVEAIDPLPEDEALELEVAEAELAPAVSQGEVPTGRAVIPPAGPPRVSPRPSSHAPAPRASLASAPARESAAPTAPPRTTAASASSSRTTPAPVPLAPSDAPPSTTPGAVPLAPAAPALARSSRPTPTPIALAPRDAPGPATSAPGPLAPAATAPTRSSRTTPAPATARSAGGAVAPATRAPAAPSSAASSSARASSTPAPRPTESARASAAPPAPPSGAAPGPEPQEEDLSDDLEVAQFFLEQGLVAEARDALRALAAAHPDHRGVCARLDALEAPAAPAHATRPTEHQLAREIEDDLGAVPLTEEAFQYSVDDVFDQFKKGVEQTVRPEDSATHYDLGIAYREMGLLEDAVHEFETALRGADARREVDCLSMLGACRMAQGAPGEAVAAYRRALASPHLTREAAKAIQFDLGDALEAAGERELALQCFRTVSQLDAGYRGVGGRLLALGGEPGPDDGAAASGARSRKRNAGSR